jgi:hypothetical protein
MVNHFSAGTALPGIKSPDKIIKFLGVHPAFALGTSHVFPLFYDKTNWRLWVSGWYQT